MTHDISPSILIIAMLIGIAGLVFTTIFHYKSLSLISRHYVNHRFSIGSFEFVMCAALLIHILEIINFGLLMALGDKLGLGTISGAKESYIADYIYYSAITYTSVGYGDLAPTGGMRALAVIVALSGLMLVSLSGAFIAGLLSRHDDSTAAAQLANRHKHDDHHGPTILDREINAAKHQMATAEAGVQKAAGRARQFAEDHGLVKHHDRSPSSDESRAEKPTSGDVPPGPEKSDDA